MYPARDCVIRTMCVICPSSDAWGTMVGAKMVRTEVVGSEIPGHQAPAGGGRTGTVVTTAGGSR